MADFVAVLRKTVGSLGNNTPEMREKVFEKARATIEAKLKAIDPPPPAALVERQRKALENAIAVVRADYAEPEAAPADDADDALNDVFAALDQPASGKADAVPPASTATAAVSPPVLTSGSTPAPTTAPESPSAPEHGEVAPAATLPPVDTQHGSVSPGIQDAPEVAKSGVDQFDSLVADPLAGSAPAQPYKPATSGGSRRLGLVAVLAIIVLAAAAGGYSWWSNRAPTPTPVAEEPESGSETTAEEPAATAEDLTPVEQVDEETVEEAAISEPSTPTTSTDPSETAAGSDKFTQRLLPDGSEVDEGPSGGPASIGEGSSIASAQAPATTPERAAPAAEEQPQPAAIPSETAEAAQSPSPAANESGPAVAVGQRAIFYEERTATAEGTAEVGTITWSLVQESPGGDLPPEPAIRAEATIPGKDVQLRMTIRRNGDQTLPASHIVEMIFLTPESFGGGAISNVSRIAFKETEQAPGSPLIGIPAKIADGFFLIALSDAPAETQANLNLLLQQSWVDIPITYQSGQRALLSLEKGIPGERVFQETLRAWSEADSG